MSVQSRSPQQVSVPRRAVLLGGLAASLPPASTATGAPTSPLAPSPIGLRFVELEKAYLAAAEDGSWLSPGDAGYEEAEARTDAAFDRMRDVAREIVDKPPASLSDIVDRALVAQSGASSRLDAAWDDLQGGLWDRAMAEVVLAVLVLAGLTDGSVERHGRPVDPEPTEPLTA